MSDVKHHVNAKT